jgi:hypothetical protein
MDYETKQSLEDYITRFQEKHESKSEEEFEEWLNR